VAKDVPKSKQASPDGGPKMAVLPEYSEVKLIEAYSVNGVSLPRGAEGTIVDILSKHKSYTVEFHSPRWCVETLAMDLVEPA
jgi:hypothetical protein